MRALVTGANGFIGSHLCEALIKRGYEVRGLVRKTSNLEWLTGLNLELVYGSLEDEVSLVHAVEGVDTVFHTAAVVRAKHRRDFVRVNSEGSARLARVSASAGVKRFVLFSSTAAVGPVRPGESLSNKEIPAPVSIYGRAKLEAERATLEYKEAMRLVILRFPAVYGPRDRDGLLMWRVFSRGVVPILGGTFSLVYVEDAVRAAVYAAEGDCPSGSDFFVSDGNCYNYQQLARVWEEVTKMKVVCFRVPRFLTFFAAGLNKWLNREGTIFNLDKVRELCQACWVCTDNRTERLLGFKAEFDLRQGAEKTLRWYKEKGWLKIG
ncbi:MAG: NAD-dependent epimerase/dehydratase family protein [bacterium]